MKQSVILHLFATPVGRTCRSAFPHILATCARSSWPLLFLWAAFSVPGAALQTLHGQPVPALKALPSTGQLAPTNRLNLAISLPLRNAAGLSNLLHQLYDPANPNYHHYLTPAQFTAKFGPTAQDYQKVIAFAKASHLQVTTLYSNRLLLDVNGSVPDVQKALHVTLHTYQHPTEKRTFYAPNTEPSLNLSVPVLQISGLDNYALPRPHLQATRLVSSHDVSANAGSGPSGTYMGTDFRKAYVPDTTLNGSGQVVGLLQFDGYTASDITYYESKAGLQNVPLQNVLLDGFSGNPTGFGGEVEVSLDIETSISMATNLSRVIVYEAGPYGNWHDILNRMATDNLARQLSCSWYIPGGGADATADQIFQQMAAQGQSFFNASGDDDAYTGLISFPGDTPYITQVGGTTLTTSGPGGAWVSETVWNWGLEYGRNGIGSGGGVSTQYPIPAWQTNISMAANQGSTTKRNTPDVALTADNVYVRADGFDYNVGGTSCAAPLWAGFAALVNQQAAASGQPPIGFINPAVDAIGTSPNYAAYFHDTTTGNNTSSASPTKFYGVAGYDLCTGWGTPAGQSLINALANPEALLITPATGFSAIGGVGGPFSVTSQNYSLTNIGTNTLTWTLSNPSAWLNASANGGTLTPGGPAATVTVSLNNAASNLVVGVYNATIWWTNQNDQFGQSRPFTLSVISPPTITQQPTNQAVLEGTTAAFSVQATGGLPLACQWQFNGTNLTDGGNLAGSATTSLTLGNVSAASVGAYTVVVTNYAGAATSSIAALTLVPSSPVIVVQPTNQTVYENINVQIAVGVVGTTPFAYQWSFNGTNLSNATNAILALSRVQLTNSGNYSVVITNLYGGTNSATAVLTVNPPPPCDPLPSGIVAWWQAESNAVDSIDANNGTLMNGVGFTNGEVGFAFNLNGVNNFVLANPAAPGNFDVGQGSGLTFEGWINPATTGTQMPIFEYERTLGSISGSDIGMLFYINLQPTGGNGAGSINANLVDTSPASHIFTSAGGLLTPGVWQHIALTYDKASGIAAIYFNGSTVAQTNFGSFTLQTSFTNLLLGARTYFGSPTSPSDKFTGSMDELSLYNRALTPNEIAAIYLAGGEGKCYTPTPPSIITQPTNQTVPVGGTAIFAVVAGGTPPLNYQWSFNGTNIANATNAIFTFTNVQLADSGGYSVLVANDYGSTNSSNAVLTVFGIPPVIAVQPTNETSIVGGTAAFGVLAGGSPPLAYQWSFNGTNLVNATNATFILTNLQLSQSGNYSVLITNYFGSTNSATAILTVNPPPPCDPIPSGIVAWWQAENNALDSVGGNNGTLMNSTGFTNGEVGLAFNLNGVNNFVVANPAAPGNFDVGQGSGLTFEGWINPTTTGTQMPIFEYERVLGSGSGSDVGPLFYVNLPSTGALYANLVDASVGHEISSASGLVVAGVWQHIALTYDKASGVAVIYLNGAAVAQANLGSFTSQTSFTNLLLGARTYVGSPTSPSDKFSGDMDELSLYNRALSANEITAIYLAGGEGKCYTPTPPSIITQPTNQAAQVGGTATFAVAASGTAPLTYQWNFNGTNIANATNATLTLTSLQIGQSGNYAVLITNLFGSTNSDIAVLNVYGIPPTIGSQPTNQTVILGNTAAFSVTAGGTAPLIYQWNFNGTNLLNATNATLILTNLQFSQSGNYFVSITNLFGSTNSATAVLTVNPPPTCDPAPSGIVAWWAAQSNALDSVAGNNGTLMNGTGFTNGEVGAAFKLNGANNYILVNPSAVSNLNVGTNGMTFEGWIKPATVTKQQLLAEYERVLGSGNGADVGIDFVIQSSAYFDVNLIDNTAGHAGHDISTPANSLVAGVWQHIAMTYDEASGRAALYLNGKVATQANLGSFMPQTSFTNLLLGARTYLGSVSSPNTAFSGLMDEIALYNRALSSNEIAAIYLAGSVGKCPLPPTIFSQPTNQSVNVNGSATFKVFAGGTPALQYQWSFNGTNILNATNAALTLTGVQLASAGNYSVLVANGAGSANSSNALLTVQAAPSITSPPTNQTVAAGDTASFTAAASGTPPLSCQWYFNTNSLVPGATNATFTLLNAQLADGGYYSIRVTNPFGSATSAAALLTVQAPPVILVQPTNLTVKVGDTAVFATAVSGSAPLNCQWTFNATNALAGVTNASVSIVNVQLANAGVYALTVTNAFGVAASSNATLTVIDTLDHFSWSAIPSPRFVNAPFGVAIQARDSINQVFTNFAGTVGLTATNGLPVDPPVSSSFTQGIWSGSVTVLQTGSNVVLQAGDGAGHAGLANPITVLAQPSLALARSGNSLLIFWPVDPSGFVLETSTSLVPPQWTHMATPPVTIGNQYLESVQLDNTNQYYRLRYTLP